jgi:hypothetical protein
VTLLPLSREISSIISLFEGAGKRTVHGDGAGAADRAAEQGAGDGHHDGPIGRRAAAGGGSGETERSYIFRMSVRVSTRRGELCVPVPVKALAAPTSMAVARRDLEKNMMKELVK